MSNRPCFAVLVICAAALMGPGAASARAAGLAPSEPCRIVAPRYERKLGKSPQSDAVRWLGGAKLTRPTATPCPRLSRPVDA